MGISSRVFAAIFSASLCLCSLNLSSQTLLDSVYVEAHRLTTPEHLVPGAIYFVDSANILRFAAPDLSRALSGIPSVKMETRGAGGSRRLQIRGSALRSPYSVRNTMLFYDGFILTEADGNSPLEWIDPDLVNYLSLVTGPSAASYGGAYGGALSIYTPSFTKPGAHAWIHSLVGTTGNKNLGTNASLSAGVNYGFKNGGISVSAIMTDNPGYRTWEWNNKTQLNLRAKYFGKSGGTHTIIAGHYDGAWALPGAINQSQVDTIPTASPGEDFNAHVARIRDIAGYKYERTFDNGLEITASFLGRTTSKINPYGTSAFYKGYKEESGLGYSLLASVGKNIYEGDIWSLDFEMTVMHLNDEINITEWESNPNSLTVIIPMRFDLTLNAQQNFVSTSWVATHNNNFRVEGQIGLSNRNRNTSGILYPENLPTDYNSKTTHNTILPRLGVAWEFTKEYSLFAQASTGFSDPTAFELVNPDDGLISDLDSESSIGMEMGLRAKFSKNIEAKFTVYNTRVNSAIVQVVQENDAIVFNNVDGGLVMNGLENEIYWTVSEHLNLRAYGSLSLHQFGDSTAHVGNALPGSPKTSGGVQFHSNYSWGAVSLDARHIGETSLNNDASSLMDPYNVIDASLSVKLPYDINLEIGGRNLFNTKYSSWPQLNGVYGKFYNPAPPRTAYLSLRWSI